MNLTITIGNIYFGIGWWDLSHCKERSGWFHWTYSYYDGNWFSCRFGPFFYHRGPY